jgi:ATP-dependent DNA helicase DinG
MNLINEIKNLFNPKRLRSIWNDYEPRDEQVQMILKVAEAFENDDRLVIEAGTGVGKSLAYLLPAVLYAQKTESRVVISTDTRALQNQLIQKDIPIAEKILNKSINAQIAFGASNYVCKRKLDNVVRNGTFGIEMEAHLKDFFLWEKQTTTGIRFEYKGFASGDFWSKVGRESDNCLGRRCPNFNDSYYFLEKEKWRKSEILIVNHHLLCSHIAGGFTLLPDFSRLIVDEAHTFPEIIGSSFGAKTGYKDAFSILNFIEGKDPKNSLVTKLKSDVLKNKLSRLQKEATSSLLEFYIKLSLEFQNLQSPKRMTSRLQTNSETLEMSLERIIDTLENCKKAYDKDSTDVAEQETFVELDMCSKRLQEIFTLLEGFRSFDKKELVYWVEPQERFSEYPYPSLCSQPIHPNEIVKSQLLPKMDTIVFTSATLSSGNSFEFFKKNIGSPDTSELILSSPFDFHKNSLIYIPKNLHDPSSENEEYHKDIIKLIPMLLDLTTGRAFVLFTSNKSLKTVYDALYDRSKYPIFSQLELGAERAKEKFLETENSVLFGVSTFWQGVDIKGDKLSSVIIAKLPFQPPGDPVLEAKIEESKKENKNPFMEIQLPYSILSLKQGMGRLIRSKTDTGIISILDPRIKTKRYGETVLESLPPSRIVFSFNDLQKEYQKLPVYSNYLSL